MMNIKQRTFNLFDSRYSLLDVKLKHFVGQLMQKTLLKKLLVMGFALWGLTVWSDAFAQEAEYNLAHRDVFGKLRRPQVSFSHEIHADTLDSEGCGICHHVQDERNGKPIYIEGEELDCKECHLQRKDNKIPALREAFHGSCTVCHRRLIKNSRPKAGPTTCGGCHLKR